MHAGIDISEGEILLEFGSVLWLVSVLDPQLRQATEVGLSRTLLGPENVGMQAKHQDSPQDD